MDQPVDVAMSVYGKPFHTAVTLLSLQKHSGAHIHRIFVQLERQQPFGAQPEKFLPLLGDKIVVYQPPLYLGWSHADPRRLGDPAYRQSVRYQWPWETSDRAKLFILHNDCVFFDDVIGRMGAVMARDGVAGVGAIGQCWNCPAHRAGRCDGARHETFQPSYEEACAIVRADPGPRLTVEKIDKISPMPLLECRLNEFACLIDLAQARPATMPFGPCLPFGWNRTDIGVDWFRGMRLQKFRFAHWDLRDGFAHGLFYGENGGHPADSDRALYDKGEAEARAWLEAHFPDEAALLRALV
ncbi:hypothetical protein M2323_001367 [Rhodoblastus acidophilus]|uniref:hypothetical protein n=1 Tax=Rhodoblastus acidophilus TaxID=1074 RepID=UPI0022240E6E|nr:hypothetical protein [Rhodoblastus acidophilus]MCW2283595.1 hypothetical protein [Rhodoblastus acidophilus]MCW2332455.1 hypothetical protein [Rhodoblastus acidophilus]